MPDDRQKLPQFCLYDVWLEGRKKMAKVNYKAVKEASDAWKERKRSMAKLILHKVKVTGKTAVVSDCGRLVVVSELP